MIRNRILDIIKRWESLSTENMDFLRNEVGFTIVAISEALRIEQLDCVFQELDKYVLKVK